MASRGTYGSNKDPDQAEPLETDDYFARCTRRRLKRRYSAPTVLLRATFSIRPSETNRKAPRVSLRHYPNTTLKNCPEVWAERHNKSDIKEFTRQRLSHIITFREPALG